MLSFLRPHVEWNLTFKIWGLWIHNKLKCLGYDYKLKRNERFSSERSRRMFWGKMFFTEGSKTQYQTISEDIYKIKAEVQVRRMPISSFSLLLVWHSALHLFDHFSGSTCACLYLSSCRMNVYCNDSASRPKLFTFTRIQFELILKDMSWVRILRDATEIRKRWT